jgi:flagellar biosynthesis/type III secretory pathway protein FliH
MSTDAIRPDSAVTLGRFPWQATMAPSRAIVRPLLTDDGDTSARARDFILPSVVAERANAAERDGYDAGFSEGVIAGRDAARQVTDAHLSRLGQTIETLSSLRTAMFQRSEHDIVRLAIAMAERIVRREIRLDRTVLLTMAQAAARKLGSKSMVAVQMHPDDLQAITGSRASSEDGPLRLTADSSVSLGACLVQSSFGSIDVGMDAQIRELVRELLGTDAEFDAAGDASADS